MLELEPNQVRWIVQAVIILLLSICVHEWGHAFVADRLGDPLPRSQGRVSMNPLRHADPIGTLLFPLIALIVTRGASPGFGWGKPVQVQPHRFDRRFTMRTGHMVVALAGPLMNVVFGTAIAITHVILIRTDVVSVGTGDYLTAVPQTMSAILSYAVFLNFTLFFFNLLPAPPLDGGAVVEGLLPTRYLAGYQRFAVYGPFVLMAVIFVPGMSNIFVWPAMQCVRGLYSGLAAVLL
jgi:Zn-dependent protease